MGYFKKISDTVIEETVKRQHNKDKLLKDKQVWTDAKSKEIKAINDRYDWKIARIDVLLGYLE